MIDREDIGALQFEQAAISTKLIKEASKLTPDALAITSVLLHISECILLLAQQKDES